MAESGQHIRQLDPRINKDLLPEDELHSKCQISYFGMHFRNVRVGGLFYYNVINGFCLYRLFVCPDDSGQLSESCQCFQKQHVLWLCLERQGLSLLQ